MVSPQLDNGYVKIANEIMDAIIKYRIPGEQRQCLDFIIRKTYGYNKKEDMISNSQFVKATGLKKPTVCRAVNGLIDKNIVIKKDNKRIPTYQFNKNYKTWNQLAKKITVIKKDNSLLSKKIPTKDNTTKDKRKYIKENFKFEKKVKIPSSIFLTDQMKAYTLEQGAPSGHSKVLFEDFCIHHRKKGSKFNDWYAAYQTWVRNDKKWNPDKYKKILVGDEALHYEG